MVVVCTGGRTESAAMARSVEGITVVEIDQASRIAALNAGDRHATLWPRITWTPTLVSARNNPWRLDRLRSAMCWPRVRLPG